MACQYSYEGGIISETQEEPSPKTYRIADLLERKRLNAIDIENANLLIADRQEQDAKIDTLISNARARGYTDDTDVGSPDINSRFIRL